VQGFGEFLADAGNALELLYGGFLQLGQGVEVFEEFLFSTWADAGDFIQDGGSDGFASEFGVEVVSKAVGFVANALEKAEGGMCPCQMQVWLLFGVDDGFFSFGEADDGGRGELVHFEGSQGCVDLTFSAVNEE